MPVLAQRILTFLIGFALLSGSILLLTNADKLFNWVEKFRDRFPILRLDPLARLNSPSLSGASAAFGGSLLFIAALLMFTVGIFGQWSH